MLLGDAPDEFSVNLATMNSSTFPQAQVVEQQTEFPLARAAQFRRLLGQCPEFAEREWIPRKLAHDPLQLAYEWQFDRTAFAENRAHFGQNPLPSEKTENDRNKNQARNHVGRRSFHGWCFSFPVLRTELFWVIG